MRNSKLTPVPTSKLAARNGGNGGYNRRQAEPADAKKPMVKRNRPIKDYHGNTVNLCRK